MLSLNAEKRVHWASAQFEHLNSRIGPVLDPMTRVRLPVDPAVFAFTFSKLAHGKELGESSLYPRIHVVYKGGI